MRLYDKWMQACRKIGAFSVDGEVPVSFVIDNIANDYYHDDRDEFEGSDFPYAVPPWNECFVEWIEPKTMRVGGELLQKPNTEKTPGSVQIGAWVKSFSGKGTIEKFLSTFDAITKSDAQSRDLRSRIGKADRMFLARFYGESGGMLSDWKVVQFVYTTDSGLPLGNHTAGPGVKTIIQNIGEGDAAGLFGTLNSILCLAFTFCNCKNVEIEDDTERLQPTPKIMRRLKLPSVRRYRLKIDGRRTSPSAGSGDCRSPAYHLCRGHFATYTAERPLFGRLVGKFWIPAHVKGKKEHGTVEKSYES